MVRTADLPVLGAVLDTTEFVADTAGSGVHVATAVRAYAVAGVDADIAAEALTRSTNDSAEAAARIAADALLVPLLMSTAPAQARATSIGNAIPSLSGWSYYGTTGTPGTWENGASVQLAVTSGHATATPKVGFYAAIEAVNSAAGDVWAGNFLTLLDSGALPNAAHEIVEFDLNNSTGTHFNDTEASFGAPAVFGIQITGLSTHRASTAVAILGNIIGGSDPMWNRGITLSNTSVRLASFQDFTGSTTSLDIWGSHTYALDTNNCAISGAVVRCGLGQPISWRNAAGSADLAVLTMGLSNNISLGNATSPTIFLSCSTSVSPLVDNAISLGVTGARFTAVWAVNGTIQTSDATLKTDISPLPESLPIVMAVEPRTFRWKVGGRESVEVEKLQLVRDVETYESEESSVEMIDGKPTWVTRTVTRETPAYDEVSVVNPDGKPALMTLPAQPEKRARDGTLLAAAVAERIVQRTHRAPRYVKKVVTVTETRDLPGNRTHWGFLASDVKAAMDKAGMDFGGYVKAEDGTENLRPDQMIPVLWRAVQELATDFAAYKVAHP